MKPFSIVVPGNLDGVHLGHRALFERALELKKGEEDRVEVLGLTFDPHPLAVIAPERAPLPLTSLERRIELLHRFGADRVEVIAFDSDYASLSPEAFVKDELIKKRRAKALVVGPDFRFGKGRTGDVHTLCELCNPWEVKVEVVSIKGDQEIERISSTAIREALAKGEVDKAARWLGRFHEVEGEVVRGDGRGRQLGFPTANIRPDRVLLPRDGVYAVIVRIFEEGRRLSPWLRGMLHLGARATFDAPPSMEVHLLNFDGNLYGKRLRIGFVARLREAQRFESAEALRRQLGADKERTAFAIEMVGPEEGALG
ncbi:MAG: riboflavin biosynthesis protein RibF [Sandaracinaceae bacterium]|nr:riboflavin biosynthesis protein RibF [Sandaracinaceae bacterium]MDW8245859.1 riboflavin biosynthesis protein RibF [Sandaracinaceae bacterium]